MAFPLTWIGVTLLWGMPDMGPLRVTLAALGVATLGLCGTAAVTMGLMARLRFYGGMMNGIFPVTVLLMGLFLPTSGIPMPMRIVTDVFTPAWALSSIREASGTPLITGACVALAWLTMGYWLLSRLGTWMRRAQAAYLP